jgi:hypothetical protein
MSDENWCAKAALFLHASYERSTSLPSQARDKLKMKIDTKERLPISQGGADQRSYS